MCSYVSLFLDYFLFLLEHVAGHFTVFIQDQLPISFSNFQEKEYLTSSIFASQIKLLFTKTLCLGPDLAWAGLYLSDSAGLNKYGNKHIFFSVTSPAQPGWYIQISN